MSSHSKSSSWMRWCNGAGEHRSRISASSQTSSRAALFVSSGDCKSSSDRWPRLQKSSATSNYSKSSKKHPRCSRGQTRLSSLHRYTSKALYCRDIYFIAPGLERKIHDSRYAERTYNKNKIGVSVKTREVRRTSNKFLYAEVSLFFYVSSSARPIVFPNFGYMPN